MENYPETLKTILNDEAYEYRRDSFLAFLKSPVRDYKESPTVKDYVEISDKDLEKMIYGEIPDTAGNIIFDQDADIKIINDEVTASEQLLKKGVIACDMITAISQHKSLIEKYLIPRHGSERIEHLINSSWRNGLFIYVPENTKLKIKIHNLSDAASSFAYKSAIICGKDSAVELIDIYESTGSGRGIQGKNVYFFLDEYSKVKYHYLQDKLDTVTDITFVKQYQDKFSEFSFFHINHGSSRVLFANESRQFGASSDYRVYGVNFSTGSQKMDIRDSSFQEGIGSSADIQVRGVVTGSSSTIHRGNIDLEEIAIKSSGFYDSKILLLSREGYANSKPGLMIKNNDTRSKHGSSISNVDEEQIFYLRSRGIDLNTATGMVTAGFVGSIIEKANNQEFTKKVYEYAEGLGINAFLGTN